MSTMQEPEKLRVINGIVAGEPYAVASALATGKAAGTSSFLIHGDLLAGFLAAARKQRIALSYGLNHAACCNFPRDIGNGKGRCNCGVADMLSALKAYEADPRF